jgi:hypothetical protein
MKSKILEEILGGLPKVTIEPNHLFFTDDNPQAYMGKGEFLAYVRKIKKDEPWRVVHLKNLFENIVANRKLANFPEITQNDKGQDVVWANFRVGNVNQKLSVLCEGRLFDFIQDYALGKLKFEFTLEDLLEEAALTESVTEIVAPSKES